MKLKSTAKENPQPTGSKSSELTSPAQASDSAVLKRTPTSSPNPSQSSSVQSPDLTDNNPP